MPQADSPLYTQEAIDALIAKVHFNADGLVAAISQDVENGEVLMVAWMNADTLRETLETGRACYWSRSRQAFGARVTPQATLKPCTTC